MSLLNVTNALVNVTDFTGLLTYSNNETGGLLSIVLVLITFFAIVIVLRGSKISVGAGALISLLLSWILQGLGEISGTVTVMFMIVTIFGMIYALMKG
jgi:hypothetical protein